MKLEVAVADVSQAKKDLTIEIAADEVKAEFEKTYDTYARHVKVPGFRPGRVPRGLVKQRFGKEVKDEVVRRLLPHALEHAIVDHKLRVIGEPLIENISINEGEALKFTASVEILPEFELKDYKGLKATKHVRRITDEDIERVVESWRENAAEFVPVEDRPSQDGDFVSVNLKGKYVEPQEQEDLKADDVQIEIGSKGVQPEFNENLKGVRAGDVREFRVIYPEDFSSQGLAGKTLDFTAEVVAVRIRELPELDDDFARQFGEYGSIQEMRDKVRENLMREAEEQADHRLRDEMLDQILNSYDFEVPSALVKQRTNERVQELAYLMLRSGVSPESIRSMNWERQTEAARVQAVRDVRSFLVVGRISDTEGIKISEEEIDKEIERTAMATGEPFARLKDRLTKDKALSSIENRLIYQKALDAIINSAEVTVEELTETPEAKQPAAETNPSDKEQAAETT